MSYNSSKISYQIEDQFPDIYKEEGQQLIQIVQGFYEFMETQDNMAIYNSRRLFDINNIDTTFTSLLKLWRDKYLSGLPFDSENIRFIIKHITDFYQRKGSKEGINLFFKLFYDQEVDVYYPSNDILKPSASKWYLGKFVQLYPTDNLDIFNDSIGKKVYGSVSGAEAFIDSVIFVDVYNVSIPLMFLGNIRGTFVTNDSVFSINSGSKVIYGRVYGSLNAVTNYQRGRLTSGNKVGDIVEITSSKGFGAKGIITEVSESISAEIDFTIEDGNYGYTVYDANTDTGTNLLISNQNLLFDNEDLLMIREERIAQDQGNNTVYATVIGQNDQQIGILLDDSNNGAFVAGDFYTLDRIDAEANTDNNITLSSIFATIPNESARAEVTEITDTANVSIILDIIGNYLDVPLNATDYSTHPEANVPMTGSAASNSDIDINTPLNEAFIPEELTIGRISKLGNINPGLEYSNDVFIVAKESRIEAFDIRNQIISFNESTTNVTLLEGHIVKQTRDWVTWGGSTISVEAKGKIVSRVAGSIYVKHTGFYPFVKSEPFTREGSTVEIDITNLTEDLNSYPMGLNAEISGVADFATGRINEIKITESGVAYQNGSTVYIKNLSSNNEIDAVADAVVEGQGRNAGIWRTKYSHIGYSSGKVIQDSDFYQDFSYEVSTSLPEATYLETLKDIAHPAGTKLFSKFSLFDNINNTITIEDTITQELTANT